MVRGKKTISRSLRGQIDTLKSLIRNSTRNFDGTGSAFKKAISELRKEGVKIKYDRNRDDYKVIR